jgi:hypothetical protein
MTLICHREWHIDREPDYTRELRKIFGQIPSAATALGAAVDGHAAGMPQRGSAPDPPAPAEHRTRAAHLSPPRIQADDRRSEVTCADSERNLLA